MRYFSLCPSHLYLDPVKFLAETSIKVFSAISSKFGSTCHSSELMGAVRVLRLERREAISIGIFVFGLPDIGSERYESRPWTMRCSVFSIGFYEKRSDMSRNKYGWRENRRVLHAKEASMILGSGTVKYASVSPFHFLFPLFWGLFQLLCKFEWSCDIWMAGMALSKRLGKIVDPTLGLSWDRRAVLEVQWGRHAAIDLWRTHV